MTYIVRYGANLERSFETYQAAMVELLNNIGPKKPKATILVALTEVNTVPMQELKVKVSKL